MAVATKPSRFGSVIEAFFHSAEEILRIGGYDGSLEKRDRLFCYLVRGATKGRGVANNIPKLLPGEGTVGRFGDLNKVRRTGDNLTPHHIPSDAFMKGKGVPGYTRDKGIAIHMEQPHPGVGGRHRRTQSYGQRQTDLSLSPRQALAREVWDVRSIYRQDGLYTLEIRRSLQQVIQQNKSAWSGTFDKVRGTE